MPTTIYQVAELAGVSPMTAARILAGSSQRSKSRDKVMSCARKLGYVRNQQAANLRTGRTQLVGIMVPFIDNPFYTKFLQEMHDALNARSYQSLIACSFGQTDDMLAAVSLFESYNVDGIVLDISEGVVTNELQQQLKQLQRRARSVVVTGAQRHDLSYDHLYLDNKNAIAKVVRHLVSRGYRSLGFIGGYPENLNIKNRLEGFTQALREAKIDFVPDWVSLGNPALDSIGQRAHQMLRATSRPRAIVCTSDMIAMTVIKAAFEAGLRVPQELAVTGFDDVQQASYLNPSLTTVRQPLKTMATDIVDLLLRRLGKKKIPIQENRYEADLVIRDST
jgi:DNA-binding LacI/PurR family transcriptional regulator